MPEMEMPSAGKSSRPPSGVQICILRLLPSLFASATVRTMVISEPPTLRVNFTLPLVMAM